MSTDLKPSRAHTRVLGIFIVSTVGFLIAIASLKSLYIGDQFSDIPTDEFFLEKEVPIAFWLGIILIVSSLLSMMTLLEERLSAYFLVSCIFLMLCMRGILSITMSKPYAYDVVSQYIPWMKTWLNEGVQLFPGPSINTPLIYYYPNHHPLSFIIAYTFLKMGVPIDFFFKWAHIVIYAIDICLIYLISKEINPAETKLGAVSAFLFTISSSTTFLTMWYCPQILGSALFLLSILLVVKYARARARITFALTCVVIYLLVITHHISTLYLIITLTGASFARLFSKYTDNAHRILRISIFWPIYTSAVWYAQASITYPHKLYDWVRNISLALRGMPQHAYQSVNLNNFLRMPKVDQVSFIGYPILIIGLAVYGLFILAKKREATDHLTTVTLGLNSLLIVVFVLGLVTQGITYPIRIMEVILILNCPLAAKSFIRLFLLDESRNVRLVMIGAIIVIVFLNTHWLFRIIQRTIPSWVSEYWLH